MVSPPQQQGNYSKKGRICRSTCVVDGDDERRWEEFDEDDKEKVLPKKQMTFSSLHAPSRQSNHDRHHTEPRRFLKQLVSFDPNLLRTSDYVNLQQRQQQNNNNNNNNKMNGSNSSSKYYELFRTRSTKVPEKQFSRRHLHALQKPHDDHVDHHHQKKKQQQLVAELLDNNSTSTAAVNNIQLQSTSSEDRDDQQINRSCCRREEHQYCLDSDSSKIVVPAAGRYFDALEGPELEILKESEEEVLLPMDKKWPFLLRFPIACFGICLGLGSQAMLWKTLSITSSSTSSSSALIIKLGRNLQDYLPVITMAIWCVALAALLVISVTYGLKAVFYLEAVRREFHHPVRVNFFFAPWIASMFLALGAPEEDEMDREQQQQQQHRTFLLQHPYVWCALATPLLMLELKIYGQWLSGGGRRRLSKVANPSTHLSLVGNFVSSLLAANVGWRQAAMFFFAVGAAHYLVLFVTLYQRLPTAEALPKHLHPVFFLFVAVPSTASVAWKFISAGHSFDDASKLLLFLALFLYSSLVVRIKFFCGFRFSIAWWAYTFPMTASAIATIHYSMEVVHPFTQALAIILSGLSSLAVILLFVSTVFHFICGSLFPNDIAIAITSNKKHCKNPKQVEEDSKKLGVSMPSLA